jgi:hypothetical protein
MYYNSGYSAQGPVDDDRWYAQYLYGVANTKVEDHSLPNRSILLITKAAPIQTGTTSNPGYDNGDASVGKGTGQLTKDDIIQYNVERKGPNDLDFVRIASVTPDSPSADASKPLASNQFEFKDTSVPETGVYTYRVQAVYHNSSSYSPELVVSITSLENTLPNINSLNVQYNSMYVNFDVSATDADQDPLSYTWDFGDGTTGSGPSMSHKFPTFGHYYVKLTISDGFSEVQRDISVSIVDHMDVMKKKFTENSCFIQTLVLRATPYPGSVVQYKIGDAVFNAVLDKRLSAKNKNYFIKFNKHIVIFKTRNLALHPAENQDILLTVDDSDYQAR